MALATLSIDLEARLASLQQGMDKAGRIAEKEAAKISAVFGRLNVVAGAIGGALSGAFAGVSVVGFIRSTNDALDALNDVKDATGASIENLSALEEVARRNGATLDTVSSVLVKFNAGLKEADGKNGVSQALAAIGVSAKELRNLDPAEALRRTAVALAGYADDGNKARIVQELFGKSIREAAPFLKDLAEQGQLNATVTTAQAEAAERFNKNLFALQANAQNAGRALVSGLIPALNEVFVRFGALEKAFGSTGAGLLAGITEKSFRDAGAGVDYFTQKLAQLDQQRANEKRPLMLAFGEQQYREERARLQKFLDFYRGVQGQVNPQAFPQASYSNEGRNAIKRLPDFLGGAAAAGGTKATRTVPEFVGPQISESLQAAIDRLGKSDPQKIAKLREELQALVNIRKASGGGAVDEAILAVEEEIAKLDPAAQAAAARVERLNQLLAATPSAELERTRDDMLLLADAFERGTFGVVGSTEAIEKYSETVRARLGTLPEDVKPALEQMSEFTAEFARNVQDTLGDTLRATIKGDFDSILKLWGNMLLEMAAQSVAADLGNKLFPNLGKGSAGGGLFSQFLGLFGFAKGGAFSGGVPIQAFASGGVFGSPTLFGMGGGRLGMMGEAGPEAIMPLRRGRDGRLGVAAAGGGTTNNYTYNVAAGVSRNEMLSALQMASRTTKAELVGMLRTKGVL
jgi:hypothetical protein